MKKVRIFLALMLAVVLLSGTMALSIALIGLSAGLSTMKKKKPSDED